MFLEKALAFAIESARQAFSLVEQFSKPTSLRFDFIWRIGVIEKPLRHVAGTLQTTLLFLMGLQFLFPSWSETELRRPTFSCSSPGNLRGHGRPTWRKELLLPPRLKG